MRVLIFSHYFPPEIGAPQARLSELACHWAAAGEDVTVLTGMPNHPTGVIPAEYRGRWHAREHSDGYRVERTRIYATPNEGILKKTLGHVTFMVSGPLLGMRRAGPADVVIVSSPTFFSIFGARAIARLRRAPLVVEIRDLWPAAIVALGVLTNRRLIRALEALELSNYRAADAVVVVTEGFRADLVRRGVPAAKVHTIRNGADLDRFRPEDDPQAAARLAAARERLGAGAGELLVLYIGAHGISHALGSVVDAAAKLSGDGVHFALVGDGADKATVAARVAQVGATNVTMLPSVPRDDVADLVAAADVCLVPLRDVPIFDTFIPSKLFEFLAAGRPVIGAVRGEAAEILRDGGALVVEPEDPAALAGAILELKADPARRARMGEQGRAYVAEHHDRARLAERYRHLLRSVVDAVNVLVTGGSGFLGGHTVPLLVAAGHEVTALARSDGAAATVEGLGARAVRGDLDEPASVADAFAASGATTLVNLASLGFGHAPAIVAAAQRAVIGRAVFVSTTSLFTGIDARSKAVRQAAEDAIRASGLDWTIVRPTMIYGTDRDRNMARLLQLVRRSPVVPLPGGGHGLQQPVHVDDLAAAIVAATERPVAIGRAYDVGGPEPLTLRQVVEEAAAAAGRRVRFVAVPAGAALAAARWYERLSRRPRLKAEQVARLAEDKAFDISAARDDLGFDPRSFRDGIRQQAAGTGAAQPA